jgi:glyoxylase-like metal-dependent hydrolase (beta-lactamase superfamily II)
LELEIMRARPTSRLSTLLAIFCFAGSFTLSLAAHAGVYPPSGVAVQATQLTPHSFYIQGLAGAASTENEGFMSNAGFVVTPAGVVVIDTLGSPSLAEAMLGQIRKVTDKPVVRVIVSHYHADHYYGLQVFKDAGAEIWAHRGAQGVIGSDGAQQRFAQRKGILGQWINDKTQRFVSPDRWLEGPVAFELGGVRFKVQPVGPAHSDEDLVLLVENDGALFVGDLVFQGRVPFVGDADSGRWLAVMDTLLAMKPTVLIPGHGPASTNPVNDLTFTRDYLRYLRGEMKKAVADMVPFDAAYAQTNWSAYENMPAFDLANRRNAYGTYLLMEKESLGQ